jgi:hypothetical protein
MSISRDEVTKTLDMLAGPLGPLTSFCDDLVDFTCPQLAG